MKKIFLTILIVFLSAGFVLAAETAIPGYQLLETYLTASDLTPYTTQEYASSTYAIAGGAYHDGFSDFVANEHIDWTIDQGATNIDAGNYTDTNTTYTAGGTLLDLTGTTFSINEGTLTDTKYCTYESGTGIECNSEGGGGVTGSAGQVAYLSDTDTAIGTSTITIDTNGNVGIGSTSPMSKLVVDDGLTGTSTVQYGDVGDPSCLKFRDSDNAGYTYCMFLNGAMVCSTNSCEAVE